MSTQGFNNPNPMARSMDHNLYQRVTIDISWPGIDGTISLSSFENALREGPHATQLSSHVKIRQAEGADPRVLWYCPDHKRFWEKKGTFQRHLLKDHAISRQQSELLLALGIIWTHERQPTSPQLPGSEISSSPRDTDEFPVSTASQKTRSSYIVASTGDSSQASYPSGLLAARNWQNSEYFAVDTPSLSDHDSSGHIFTRTERKRKRVSPAESLQGKKKLTAGPSSYVPIAPTLTESAHVPRHTPMYQSTQHQWQSLPATPNSLVHPNHSERPTSDNQVLSPWFRSMPSPTNYTAQPAAHWFDHALPHSSAQAMQPTLYAPFSCTDMVATNEYYQVPVTSTPDARFARYSWPRSMAP